MTGVDSFDRIDLVARKKGGRWRVLVLSKNAAFMGADSGGYFADGRSALALIWRAQSWEELKYSPLR